MTTRKNISISLAFLCLAITACNSNPQPHDRRDSTESNVGKFDLARLRLTENLPDLMAAQAIKNEPKNESDHTLFGFEVFKTTDAKILRFENVELAGVSGQPKNQVLFHYSEEKKTLVFYEVTLYDQAQTDTLIKLLSRIATPTFKQTKLPAGALEIDENGNAVKPGSAPGKTFRVWENKSTGLAYFLLGEGSGTSFSAKLIVLNTSVRSGKDWISRLSLDWYKNTKSEPL